MEPSFEKSPASCELLAPAGNPEMLHAAIDAGADAAYLGLESFNARRNAKNFDFDTFEKACEYAHIRAAKLYVTMNTIIFEDELESALKDAVRAFNLGADAFIVQDLGFAYELKKCIKNVRLHASTQMSIHSLAGLRMASELGFSRVTLAREMSLDEIERLCEEGCRLGIEIETFAHGALCISYSGQCLMSSMIGCRSANRGLCAQPCRLEYELVDLRDSEKAIKVDGQHLLSPKDLCSIDDIGKLVNMGVASLKIEGRMKSSEYAHTVVSIYRKQLDRALLASVSKNECPAPESSDRDKLGSVFSRGFSSSYLEGNRTNSMMSYQRPNNRGQFVGRIKSVTDDSAVVSLEQPLKAGDVCEIWTGRGNLVVGVSEDSLPGKKTFTFSFDDEKFRKGNARQGSFRPGKGDRVFRVRSADAQIDVSEMDPRIAVSGNVVAKIGEPLRIEFALAEDQGTVNTRLFSRLGFSVVAEAEGAIVEAARTKSITRDEIYEHVDRMGQTPFRLVDLSIELDEGVGMGFSQIHNVRAQALESLKLEILRKLGYANSRNAKVSKSNIDISNIKKKNNHIQDVGNVEICTYVSNPECARVAKRNGADAIYVNALNYRRKMAQMCGVVEDVVDQAGYPKRCIQVMGPISHDKEGQSREAVLQIGAWDNIQEGTQVLVESIDGIGRAIDLSCNMQVGPELPIVNHLSLGVIAACGVKKVWLSSELSLAQIEKLANISSEMFPEIELGVIIAGAQELMKCEHCVLMSIGKCDENCPTCSRRKVPFALRDRMGYEFPVVTDYLGRSHIYNSLSTDNMNSIPRLIDAGVSSFMLNAQLLDVEQTAQEMSRLSSAVNASISGEREIPKRKGTTTAHFHRPVA